jgi:hypothetical protein
MKGRAGPLQKCVATSLRKGLARVRESYPFLRPSMSNPTAVTSTAPLTIG